MHQLVFARSDLTAQQIVAFRLGMRREMMELVAGTRDTLARSRALLVEADVILARGNSLYALTRYSRDTAT
jgi:hypothetical protein